MAGYNGYSMSNNAVDAYENGLRPYSKWTKQDILEQIERYLSREHDLDYDIDLFKKFRAEFLKKMFLESSEWHHTGKYFNETSFYSFDSEVLDEKDKEYFLEMYELFKIEENAKCSKSQDILYVHARYGEWSGTRRHPKLIEREADGCIINNRFYFLDDPQSYKKIDGRHFEYETLAKNRKPKSFDTEKVKKIKELYLKKR